MIEIKNGCAIHPDTNETVVLEHVVSVCAIGSEIRVHCVGGIAHGWSTLRDAACLGDDASYDAEYERAEQEARDEVERLSVALRLQRVHAHKTISIGSALASTRLWSSLTGVDLAGLKVTLLWAEGGQGVLSCKTPEEAEALRAEICEKWEEWRMGVSVD